MKLALVLALVGSSHVPGWDPLSKQRNNQKNHKMCLVKTKNGLTLLLLLLFPLL